MIDEHEVEDYEASYVVHIFPSVCEIEVPNIKHHRRWIATRIQHALTRVRHLQGKSRQLCPRCSVKFLELRNPCSTSLKPMYILFTAAPG